MTKEEKLSIIQEFARQEGDVGSVEVQVAVLSRRVAELTEHMKINKKDHSTRRGLIALVNRRRKLLKYLSRESHDRYLTLIKRLNLRR
jgi:small subunit ribosomal protein S15